MYNHSSAFPHDAILRHRFMMQPCISVTEHLQFGSLSMGYDGLWHNVSVPNIYQVMTPTTAVELGQGFLIGLERTLTTVSGLYTPPAGSGPYTASKVHSYEDCHLVSVVNGGTSVELQLQPGTIAAIVWVA